MKHGFMAVGCALALGACASTAQQPTTNAASAAEASKSAVAPLTKPGSPPVVQTSARNVVLPAERSVYFDYDDYSIKPAQQVLLAGHAKYLSANPNQKTKIEGHADERGSREYNLALGQKRAEAVKQALRVNGATESQLEAISYGKEKPRNTGHDEEAWAENRRADIVLP